VNATAGETCDDGGPTATCDSDCTAAVCGDGVANALAGEQCDTGGETALCDGDCSFVICGDGRVNTLAGEVCDDGINNGTSGFCASDCSGVLP
jgi:hypothetical protein